MQIVIVNPQFKCNNPAELLETLGIPWDAEAHEAISMTTDQDGCLTIDNVPEDIADQVQAIFNPADTVVALQAQITGMQAILKSAKLM